LQARGIHAIMHRAVPPNDGGVALGQLMVGNSQ
jgi:hydrogenase maturation protein HypF